MHISDIIFAFEKAEPEITNSYVHNKSRRLTVFGITYMPANKLFVQSWQVFIPKCFPVNNFKQEFILSYKAKESSKMILQSLNLEEIYVMNYTVYGYVRCVI
jgi:hypothetical protein